MSAHDRNDTAQKVTQLIAENMNVDPSVIKTDATFESLGADSLDMVEMIMKVEEQFGLEIRDEEADKLHTVGDVIAYVQERRTK